MTGTATLTEQKKCLGGCGKPRPKGRKVCAGCQKRNRGISGLSFSEPGSEIWDPKHLLDREQD